MDATAPDPLDALWTPEERAEARERCRERAAASAQATLAPVPAHLLENAKPEAYVETIVSDWLRVHDAYVDRARQILSAPEAVGRERLARDLILNSQHSALAAIIILRAGADISAMPTGGARKERVTAIRRAASPVGGL